MNNPYDVLGVPKDATEDTIKTSFRKLAMEHHPDRNQGSPESEAKFKEINEAYEILKDPQKRAAFDYQGAGGNPRQSHQGFREYQFRTGSGPFNFDDIFDAFTAQRRQRNNDLIAPVLISLEEAFTGKDVQLAVRTATGIKHVSVSIPAGVDEGATLRIAGAGEHLYQNLPPGDLYVKIRVEHHREFARVAQNLVREFLLNGFDAMLGTDADIRTIDGQTVRVTIPPGVQPGQRLRVPGFGMPIMGQPSVRGDLLVALNIAIPENLTEEQKNYIRLAQNPPPPSD